MSPQPAEVEVPDVVGFAATDASEILTRAGLVPSGPAGRPAPTSGTVCVQRPAATALAVTGSTVVLETEAGGSEGAMMPQPDDKIESTPA